MFDEMFSHVQKIATIYMILKSVQILICIYLWGYNMLYYLGSMSHTRSVCPCISTKYI
jgi:hypothetical protein